ncbi:hypothetical protein ACLOJK_037907, partial [Asimina triloba]
LVAFFYLNVTATEGRGTKEFYSITSPSIADGERERESHRRQRNTKERESHGGRGTQRNSITSPNLALQMGREGERELLERARE